MNLDKIKKLLSLSQSSNENESAVAFAKAKKLADEAGIDLKVIEAQLGEKQVKEDLIQEILNQGSRRSVCQKFVTQILRAHFKVEVMSGGARWNGGMKMWILGRKSDVEFATFANIYLNEEFMRRWHYYKNTNNAPARERNAFVFGLYKGYKQKLEEADQETKREKIDILPQSVQSNYSLIIVEESAERKQFLNKLHPVLIYRKGPSLVGCNARHDVIQHGIDSGRCINVNRPIACNE